MHGLQTRDRDPGHLELHRAAATEQVVAEDWHRVRQWGKTKVAIERPCQQPDIASLWRERRVALCMRYYIPKAVS